MQRIKHPPIRNKINMDEPTQVRAWTRRLRIPADELKAIVEKVGNSVAVVAKEVELQRLGHEPCPVPSIQTSALNAPADGKLSAAG